MSSLAETADHQRFRTRVESGPMRPFQVKAVAGCVLMNATDGFDVLAMAFIAPAVSREWALTPERVGFMLSAGIVGMAIGAIGLSWLADVIGRKAACILCMVLVALGMFLASTAQSVEMLAVYRVIAGLGVGASNAASGALVVEYSSQRRRELSLGAVVVGNPMGSMIGGIVAAWLLVAFGWRSVLIFGGLLPVALIPFLWLGVPESAAFLLTRQPKGALKRVNDIFAKLDLAPLAALPPRHGGAVASGTSVFDVFHRDVLATTLLLCLTYFLFMMSQYTIINWVPKLMTQEGFSDIGGISYGIAINIGAVVGAGTLGLISARRGVRPATISFIVLAAVAIAAFGAVPVVPAALTLACLLIGYTLYSSIVGMFSIMASSFPHQARGMGIGVATSAGRLGSVCGIYMAGVLLGLGFTRATLCAAIALPALLAAPVLATVAARRARAVLAPTVAPE